ncbi:MAG: hypothetical protein K8E66_01235, partial [Phycisphaerales bacterium]|nr:hypothetical protein [Phycisphaerales bacterium]
MKRIGLTLFMFWTPALAGDVLYVDQNAAGGLGDGSSWQHAFIDLQDALAAARAEPGGFDAIWIAGGVYTPAPPGGDRGISFEMVDGVALMGGFEGDEADPSDRPPVDDPSAPETVLSGDLHGDDEVDSQTDEFMPESRDDNAHRVIDGTNSRSPTLDRLHVVRGVQDLSALVADSGAGAFFSLADQVSITDCEFNFNFSAGVGGAVLIAISESATIEGSVFFGNQSGAEGGAVWFGSNVARTNTIEIRECRFERNRVIRRSASAHTRGGSVMSHAFITRIERSG